MSQSRGIVGTRDFNPVASDVVSMGSILRAVAVTVLLLTSVLAGPVLAPSVQGAAADAGPNAGPLDAAGNAGNAAGDAGNAAGTSVGTGADTGVGTGDGGPADVVDAPASDVETGGAREGVREGGTAMGTGAGAAVRPAMAADGDEIHLRNALRQADPNGEYAVTTRVRMPDRVTELQLALPSQARDVEATGFTKRDGRWAWDGETNQPTLTYRMPANRTTQESGPLEGDGNYIFVDVGDWAVVQPPGIGASWRYTGSTVTLDRRNVVDGEGATSRGMAYLGPHETYTHQANDQEFRLVVPAAADLEESPEAIFESLESASGRLHVGDRDTTVLLIAAPTTRVGWGVRGLQTGDATAWVRDSESLATPDNVWVHEYVHTRQQFRTGSSARWFTEATATYYAALLPLERNQVGFDAFRDVLARGEGEPQASSVLADPGTWAGNAQYTKGALVAGEIDRRIRLATNSSRTLASVFRELNAHGDPIRNEDVLATVADASTTTVASEAEQLTTTETTTSAWDREAHSEAFGQQPARIVYSLDSTDAVVANGEFRTRPVDRDPVTLAAGETLRVAVTVENTGGTTGEYDLSLAVDDETVATRTGRLDAGNATVETFERTFEKPGEYVVMAGGHRLRVVVSEPAPLAVTDLTVEPEAVVVGDRVRISGIASNEAGVPGRANVTITVDGERTVLDPIRLDVGERTVIRREVTLDTAGTVVVSVGSESRTITVTEPERATTSPGTAAGGATPGFGPVAATLALLAAASLASRVGRSGRFER